VAAITTLAVLAAVGLIGNSALSASSRARKDGHWSSAISYARHARTWMPWSPRPWTALGEAELGAGLVRDARESFRKAASIDPGDWRLWYNVARVSTGRARVAALRRAAALYPGAGLLPTSARP
jgi:Flp pilus assembly protein TadD